MPSQPDFSIEAFIPTEVDGRDGVVPNWCDLVLDIEHGGSTQREHLTRAAGEVIIDVLHETLHPWAGKSLLQMMWARLEDLTKHLIKAQKSNASKKVIMSMRGECAGLAWAIALVTNPYNPDVDTVREELMTRIA